MAGRDRSRHAETKDGLLLREAEFASAMGSFERDLRTGATRYSTGFCRIFGLAPGNVNEQLLLERVHSGDRQMVEEAIARAEKAREPFSFEARIVDSEGQGHAIRARGMVVCDQDERPVRLIATIQDVTEEVETRAARELLSYVVDSTDDAIITKDPHGIIRSWNRGAERLYGYTAEEAIGAPIGLIEPRSRFGDQREILRRVFGGESIDHYETERVRKDGTVITVSLTISPVRDANGRIVSAAVIARDISARVGYERRLQHLADHDQLTGLFNRRRFDEELKRELARAGRFGTSGALLSVDLDNFKHFNDSAGHAAGDTVLREVSDVLQRRFRRTDFVARLGGDEFAVLLLGVAPEEARSTAHDLLVALHGARPVFGGKPLRITASIGVACFEGDDGTADELLVNADLAMYAAKSRGRDRIVVYSAEEARRARAEARQPWPQRIRDALESDSFVLHLQPIVELRTGKVSHGELLLRMRDDRGRLIAPGAFLPAAERSGMIHDIDRWVVRHAIRLISGDAGAALPHVGINLSGDTVVGDPDMLGLIERELRRSEVDPSRLIFEVTETAAIANMGSASRFAHGLTALGCSLALDDFGTGFASFSYLKHLPVRYLKLDGEFIQNLPRSEIDRHMVKAVVTLSQGIGIKTVAEWVTDEETLQLLRSHEVDYAQGFHIGRPGPVGSAA